MARRNKQSKVDGGPLRRWLESLDARGKRWAGLIALVTALATVVIGVLAWQLPRGEDSKAFIERPQSPSRLKLVDLLVRDKVEDGTRPSRVEVILNNTGGRLGVIDGARIEVERVYELPLCFTQGGLPLSSTYGVSLPIDSAPGDLIEVPLHQQVGADEADRFGIEFGVKGNGEKELSGVYIFELDISLLNDGPQSVLPLGQILVSAPHAPSRQHYFLIKGDGARLNQTFNYSGVPAREFFWAEYMGCWRSNTVALKEALAKPAIRSTALDVISDKLVTPTFAAFEPSSD